MPNDVEHVLASSRQRAGQRPVVLFVANQVSDFARYRLPLARSVAAQGFEVHIAVPEERDLRRLTDEGFAVHTYPLRRFATSPIGELRCVLRIWRLVDQLRPALVHSFSLKPSLYGGIAGRLAGGLPTVSSLTGLGHLFASRTVRSRLLQRLVWCGLRYAAAAPTHRLTVQHEADRAVCARYMVDADRIRVVRGSGVDAASFSASRELPGTPVVLMAGRLLFEKGVADFVRAAAACRARNVTVRFVLAGEPDYGHPSAIPEATLAAWHAEGDVVWLGWCDDMPSVIARSHIVCLPTRYSEGVPRILLEAAASGRSVVATDVPGCRRIVRHGVNGLLVPVSDHEALVDAIVALVRDGSRRRAMGASGRHVATSQFTESHAIEDTFGVYHELLGRRIAPASLPLGVGVCASRT